MQQLTGVDAAFLYAETRAVYGHVSGLAIYDPSTRPGEQLTLADTKALLRERLHLVPPLRRRLATVPLDLDHPYWIEDPDFDLDYHVRELALPEPGNDLQLADQAARIAARPLDRRRPLWELYLIQGLHGGRVAQLTKIHHAAIDGVSGAEILGLLLDLTPEAGAVAPPEHAYEPDAAPGAATMLGRGVLGLARQPLRVLNVAPRALANLSELPGAASVPGARLLLGAGGRLRRALAGGGEQQILERPLMKAPRTPFNGPITPHRRFAFGSVELSAVKQIKDLHGLTVNDVVIGLCAGGLRSWLLARDALPAEPLLAMVPVSVRTEAQQGEFGNQVSVMIVPIPTHEADPLERLRLVHDTMSTAKERHKATPATLLQDFTQFVPPAVLARAARVVGRVGLGNTLDPPFNLVISNVPGPQVPLYSSGALLLGNYPLSAILDGVGLNMTVMSYNGSIDFGLVSCREMIPDIWQLLEAVQREVAVLGG
ncbi:MAG: wax ester/triacylglycerol synthase family O-acyltransferase [Solirubrobacteraceae bacterium]